MFRPAARRSRSLRRDLALGFGGGILLVWMISLLLGWLVLRGEIDEIYDAALMRTADRLLALSGDAGDTRDPKALRAEILAPDGQPLFRTTAVDPEVFARADQDGFTRVEDLQIFTMHTPRGNILRVADPVDERREAAREALATLLLPSLLLLPLAIAGAWVFTRRRFAPVSEFSAEVAGRDASDLRPLQTEDLPAELEPVRRAVDNLMATLSEALAAEHNFSSNAAHELRTPIAATIAQTQRLVAEADSPALRARAEAVDLSLHRIARLSEKLIDLARADAATARASEVNDMVPVLRLVAADFRAPLTLAVPPHPVMVDMSVDAFAVIARNLIENALTHGRAPVLVSMTEEALTVDNAGPIVPQDMLARLTQRFERAGSRKSGSGLGLAIVDALVRKAGLALVLHSPVPGEQEGFRAQLQLRAVIASPQGLSSRRNRSENVPTS